MVRLAVWAPLTMGVLNGGSGGKGGNGGNGGAGAGGNGGPSWGIVFKGIAPQKLNTTIVLGGGGIKGNGGAAPG